MAELTVVTICVEYSDILSLTLPWTQRWAKRIVVGTSLEDNRTQQLCQQAGVECFVTNAFYLDGAYFNKGRVIERIFEKTGRCGWYLVLDADIVCKDIPDLGQLDPTCLHCKRRRVLEDVSRFVAEPTLDWTTLPVYPDQELPGYFHLFHSSASVCSTVPWYGVTWKHAGGCDSEFERKWPGDKKRWLPGEVLHLGEIGQNWFGRVSAFLDGQISAQAAERRRNLDAMIHTRRRSDLPRYFGERIDGLSAW